MGDKKSGYPTLFDKYAPDLTADQRQALEYALAPAQTINVPTVNVSKRGVEIPARTIDVPTANISSRGVEFSAPATPAPPPGRLEQGIGQAFGGQGAAAPSLFDRKYTPIPAGHDMPDAAAAAAAGREPRGGDWAGAQRYATQMEAKKRAENLAGATFVDGAGATGAGGGAPVMVSPGGRTPHSWATQTQEGTKLSPETKDAAETAEQAGFQAAGAHLGAETRAAEEELGILRRHELVQQARETELRQRAEQQRARFEASQARLDEMTKAVQEDRIDPEQWWKTRSAGQLFAAGLGIALGGFANGLSGGRTGNPGLEMVNNAIAQEIDSQKRNAALHREKLEDQRSLLGQMAKTFGDERVAEDAAYLVYLERAKTQLAAAAANAKSDFAKARYADAIKEITGQIAGRREKWDQLESDHVVRVQHDVNAPPTYAGAGPLDKHDREEASAIAKERVERGIPQARSQLADIDRSIDALGEGDIPGVGPIAGLVPDVAAKQVFGDRAIAGRQAVAAIKNATRKSIAGASLTESEKVELNKQLEGAHDAASLRRVVQAFRESVEAQERGIYAIGSDKASDEVARRLEARKQHSVPLNKPSVPYVKPPE